MYPSIPACKLKCLNNTPILENIFIEGVFVNLRINCVIISFLVILKLSILKLKHIDISAMSTNPEQA